MKVCEHCGTENSNNAAKCSACGSGDLSNKCDNCGTKFKSAFCPTCGTKASARPQKCPKCGEEYYSAACPKCGYSAAREAAEKSNTSGRHVVIINETPKKKKASFGIVLLWIFFLPIMGIIAIWKAAKIPKLWKIILTIVISVITIVAFVNSAGNEEQTELQAAESSTKTAIVEQAQEATAESEVTAAPTDTPEPTATPKQVFSVQYDNGQYKAGMDIDPGEYMALATNGYGYICVSADANQDNITFNEVFETNTVFTIEEGEYLELSGCTAVLADEFYAEYKIDTDKDGIMLKVGHDIEAGEYKLEATAGMGYYCIFNDTRHTKIVSNEVFETTSYVTVKDGQYLVLSGCKIINN